MEAVGKYLEGHAEPEVRLAPFVAGTYRRALVVPACREEPSLLDGYVTAAQTSGGQTLAVLVVNGADDAPPDVAAANVAFLDALRGRLKRVRDLPGPPTAFLGTLPRASLDVLVIDRASPGAEVPRKEGVGLARKIGLDLALALHESGRVESRVLYGTDADATLPDAFFDRPDLDDRPGVAAAVFPFWHDASDDLALSEATALYELSLRYYVEGLAWAGSPYAFHTLGSATAVVAGAYAAVRGAPKREAAEDFYLLNKIAKVGAVVRAPGAPVRLRSRRSDRTPFGTGAAVSAALSGDPPRFHAPECFVAVKTTIELLDEFAADADVARFFQGVNERLGAASEPARRLLTELGAEAAFAAAATEAKTEDARRRRVHTWFDAFRTLKLVHAVEEHAFPRLTAEDAFARAPFTTGIRDVDRAADPLCVAPRVALARSEAESASTAREAVHRLLAGPTVSR
ncbi:MAG TPA: hypothetical protein VHE30_25810 [Polyangiaceae bacterium]|nr:hypothetical protein [Polyangiaceae bacterium]